MNCTGRLFVFLIGLGLFFGQFTACCAEIQNKDDIHFKVISGSIISPFYTTLNLPFWSERIRSPDQFHLRAETMGFEEAGITAREALALVRFGVVGFAVLPLSEISGDDPDLNGADLPGLNRRLDDLNTHLALWRNHLAATVGRRHAVDLLAVLAGPPITLQCRTMFTGMDDLAGRRVRVANRAQFALMKGLGAFPVVMTMEQVAHAFLQGRIDCALAVSRINPRDQNAVAPYVSALPIAWEPSIILVNKRFWATLPEGVRDFLNNSLHDLEYQFWANSAISARSTQVFGYSCETCDGMRGKGIRLVPTTEKDDGTLRAMLTSVILPDWARDCGQDCIEAWNRTIGVEMGLDMQGSHP